MTEPKILASTPRWVWVAKPAGWLTIPGRPGGNDEPVLRDWVQKSYPDLWVVHRLDRETSGVVLFARTAEDHAEANSWFEDRKMKKVYLCLAQGRADLPFFKITYAIEGAPSTTQVEVLENFETGFLARVYPRTGRRHQIRIHLSQSGYPILGDTLYGGSNEVPLGNAKLRITRVALHAESLELPTGEKMECPLPDDFADWIEQLLEGVASGHC